MNDNFIVSAHALERFQERFPALWKNDTQAAQFIHNEVEEALVEGRAGYVAPIELATFDPDRWQAGDALYTWIPDRNRGYVLAESPDGLLVTTVLVGRDADDVRKILYGEGRPRLRRDRKDEDPKYEAAAS